MRRIIAAGAALAACLALPAFASAAPLELGPGVKQVGTAELKAWMDQKREMVLINALSPLEFRDKTIPGSINVPVDLWEEGRVTLPAPKEALLVFF